MTKSWQRIFCAAALSCLTFSLAATTHAWVHNETSFDVWIKPELTDQPYPVTGGGKYHLDQDGLAVPALRRNAVFKTCDRCAAIVRGSGIETRCEGAANNVCQATLGGWKDEQWVKQHPNWQPLFDRSR